MLLLQRVIYLIHTLSYVSVTNNNENYAEYALAIDSYSIIFNKSSEFSEVGVEVFWNHHFEGGKLIHKYCNYQKRARLSQKAHRFFCVSMVVRVWT